MSVYTTKEETKQEMIKKEDIVVQIKPETKPECKPEEKTEVKKEESPSKLLAEPPKVSLETLADYQKILEPLRVSYIQMEDAGNIYLHTAKSGNLSAVGSTRIAQEIMCMQKDLPCYSSNSVFVRIDQQRTDLMKVLITGSEATPYAHGAFEFHLFTGHTYPAAPPKLTLVTTGGGQVRFNPNLYNNGYVCLSLLGTWSGNGSENWCATSTIMQVILSIQSLVMDEDIYYKEPAFESGKGMPGSEALNRAYCNIVRYCNVRFAMIEQIRDPAKGFEKVIHTHFRLKKDVIMKDIEKWIAEADKPADYTGLVASHNSMWCTFFGGSNETYKAKLVEAYNQLKDAIKAIPS